MRKMRECSWYRRLGVGALPSADLGGDTGPYSSLLAAKSCLFEPFSSFVKWADHIQLKELLGYLNEVSDIKFRP